jgi:DinB superfamily
MRPEKSEYAPYYEGYVSSIKESEVVAVLRGQIDEIESTAKNIPESIGDYAYETGKWTIKQLLGHLIDGERVFAYRALRFSRRDNAPLEGFDQDPYVLNGNFESRTVADLVEELILLRKANCIFFGALPTDAWDIVGVASNAEVSVRGIAYIMAGHVRHHLTVLNTRYLMK